MTPQFLSHVSTIYTHFRTSIIHRLLRSGVRVLQQPAHPLFIRYQPRFSPSMPPLRQLTGLDNSLLSIILLPHTHLPTPPLHVPHAAHAHRPLLPTAIHPIFHHRLCSAPSSFIFRMPKQQTHLHLSPFAPRVPPLRHLGGARAHHAFDLQIISKGMS